MEICQSPLASCHRLAKYLEFVLTAAHGSHDDHCLTVVEHHLITRLKLLEPWRRSWHEVIACAGVPKEHYGDMGHGMDLPEDIRSAVEPGKGAVAPNIAFNNDDITAMAGCIFVCKKLLARWGSLDFSTGLVVPHWEPREVIRIL
jgi:hypothetical protein